MLDATIISKKINDQLKSIGIDPEVNGEPSHTANLVSIIVAEIIAGIKNSAEVNTVVNTTGIAQHPGTIETQNGTGYGAPGSIK